MLEEEQVQELFDSITVALQDLAPANEHFKTVYESQIYVLTKVLQK